MSRRTTRVAGAAVAVTAGMLIGAAVPASASFLATGKDPAGDATHADPGRDIVDVGMSYNRRTGELRGGVRLAGEPHGDAPAVFTLVAGRRTATGCDGYPAIGFTTQTDRTWVDWIRVGAPGAAPAASGSTTKDYDGAVEEYSITSSALAGARPNCVMALLSEPGNAAAVYDVAGPFALRALPELDARLGTLPKAMAPATTRTVRLTLRNPGDATTGRIRLGIAGARGLKVKMPRTIPALRPGARRVVALKVTLSPGARATTTLRVTALAKGGLRAIDQGDLRLHTPSRAGGGGGGSGGGSPSPQLCYRYTWVPPYGELVLC